METRYPDAPVRTCTGCHGNENHPRHVIADGRNYHFDCLPDDVVADVIAGLTPGAAELFMTAIAHAKGDGVPRLTGDDLRDKTIELFLGASRG